MKSNKGVGIGIKKRRGSVDMQLKESIRDGGKYINCSLIGKSSLHLG